MTPILLLCCSLMAPPQPPALVGCPAGGCAVLRVPVVAAVVPLAVRDGAGQCQAGPVREVAGLVLKARPLRRTVASAAHIKPVRRLFKFLRQRR